jgi:hypothetical protein
MLNAAELRMPAYESIAQRPMPLTTEEASQLFVDDVTIIHALREYHATDHNKFRALLGTVGMYFISYHIFTSCLTQFDLIHF